jgi:hypothetical protein
MLLISCLYFCIFHILLQVPRSLAHFLTEAESSMYILLLINNILHLLLKKLQCRLIKNTNTIFAAVQALQVMITKRRLAFEQHLTLAATLSSNKKMVFYKFIFYNTLNHSSPNDSLFSA